MAEKTIKISPIPESVTQEEIKKALSQVKVNRIHLSKTEAYVELESTNDLETLEFIATDNQLDKLNGAEFQKVEPSFRWESLSSDSSSIQQLKEDRQHFDKHEESPWILTDPVPQNLITISSCDPSILSKLTQNTLKSTVFSELKSINRILKKGNKIILELEDAAQAEKLELLFPNLKVSSLGSEAYVNLSEENEPNFSTEWIEQHKKQTDIKSQNEDNNNSHKKQEEQEKPKRSLHDEIMPKLNKLTSMETDFLNSQSNQQTKSETRHFDIAEQSEQNIHTRNEIKENRQQFVLADPADKQREEEERRKRQQQRVRLEEEEKKRQMDQVLRIQKQKQQEERRRRQQQQQEEQRRAEEERKRHEEQQARKRKQEAERKRHEQEERRKRHEEQERKRKEEDERKRKEEEERQRKQKQQHQRKQTEHRKQQQRLESERKEEQRRNRQRIAKEEQERKRKQAEQEHKRVEARRKSEQESVRRQQQSDRSRAEQEQRKSVERGEFILLPNAENVKRNLETMIGTGTDRIESVIEGQSKGTPLLFWSLIIVAVFAMLVM